MATTTYESEATTYNQPLNIFKGLGGIIYRSALTTAIPAAFTQNSTSDLIQLDTVLWQRLGLITQKEGIVFNRTLKQDNETSWGYEEPTREDFSEDVESATFIMQEINRYAMELYHCIDLSSVHPDATTGEVTWNRPQLTVPVYQRLIFMAVDGSGTDRRYKFKVMPRAKVTAVKDEAWQQAGATQFPVTVTATVDPTLGYSVREVLAGPGQKTRNAGANFV